MVATHAETHGHEGARGVAADAPVLIGLSLLVCAYLLAYWPTFVWVAGEWSAGAGVMSHGYLVSLISIVLFMLRSSMG